MLEQLLPRYIATRLYQAVLEAKASEEERKEVKEVKANEEEKGKKTTKGKGKKASEAKASDEEADRLDTAWDVTPHSRLGCQAVIRGDVVCELPMYTRNYVQEGGGIQLGKSTKKGYRSTETLP